MQGPANTNRIKDEGELRRDHGKERLDAAKGQGSEWRPAVEKDGKNPHQEINRQQQQGGAKQAPTWPLFGRSQRVAHRVQNMEEERYPKIKASETPVYRRT